MFDRSIAIVGCVGIRAVLGSSVARHAGGSNDCIRNSSRNESMDTIYVPVCFKCRVSEHEIATGRRTRDAGLARTEYANCGQHMCRVLLKFPNNFGVLTNFPSLNDLCVCGVCVLT